MMGNKLEEECDKMVKRKSMQRKGREEILKNGMKKLMCFVSVLLLVSGCIGQVTVPESVVEDSSSDQIESETSPPESSVSETSPPLTDIIESALPIPAADIIITVIYDNDPYDPDLTTDWGFSCLIRGCEKTILFDTGGNGGILLKNMEKLGIDCGEIDVIILSHIHGDHVDGLPSVLAKNNDVTVYVLQSFPFLFKENVRNLGADVVEVSRPVKICENVYSSGEISGFANEQALVMKTDKGLIIITGCAHPGIVGMVNRAKNTFQDDILLVMGGFHLVDTSRYSVEKIISDFRTLNVLYAGPCHCTGLTAMELFEQEYKEHYVEIGVGTIIYAKDLG
ncbi:MAG: MBL fold metallo-hydrolase [Theionarchaea archaeon]|nr:MBL fold metallo-hydrolase [Theionarchaea archaeon]